MPIPRRQFLSGSLASAATLATAGALAVRKSSASPNEKVKLGLIGVNGIGHYHTRNLVQRDDCVIDTLCDIDQNVLERVAATVNQATNKTPKLVGDFRQVLDDKSIDAVIIATPHHWHLPIAVRALQAGKHIYLEKPASHVFREGRLLIEATRKYNRVVQHGAQRRSSEITERAGEVLASGIIGEVKMAKAFTHQRIDELHAKPDAAAPPGVNYDMWLGPAPERPFNPNRFHRTWRQYRDYGNGDIGDDGIHDLDMANWGLGVKTHPVRITAHGSRIDLGGERQFPDNMMVAYHYAEGKVLLYEDRLWTPYGMHGFDNGNVFYGTEGYMIYSIRDYFQVYLGKDEKKGPGMTPDDVTIASTVHHMTNFFDSIRGKAQPNAPAEVAHRSCALVHLGETAYRVGRVLHFDAETETVRDDPEANALLTKQYREPWGVPEVS